MQVMAAQPGAGRGGAGTRSANGQIVGSTKASLIDHVRQWMLPAPRGCLERQRKAHVRMDLAPFAQGKVGGFAAWATGFESVLPGILNAPLPQGALFLTKESYYVAFTGSQVLATPVQFFMLGSGPEAWL